MKMILQFFTKSKYGNKCDPVSHNEIILNQEIILMLPKVGETVRFFEYIKDLTGLEWTKNHLSENNHIVDKIDKVFTQNPKGDISMLVNIFLKPSEDE